MQISSIKTLGQKGFTIIEAMTAVALAGVVVAAMATVYVNMRDDYARDQAAREAESLRQYIQGIINQPGLCSKAMLVGGAMPFWDYSVANSRSQDINQFQIVPPNGVGPGTIITLPGPYGNSLWITRMYLREPISTADYREGIPYQTPSNMDTGVAITPMQIVAAKLVIELQVRTANPLNNRFLKNKVVDVTVGVDQATKQVLMCTSALRSSPTSYSCNNTTVNPTHACPLSKWCTYWYYIEGFDASGMADCRCASNCVGTNPMGPGTAVVGGAGAAGGIMATGGVGGAAVGGAGGGAGSVPR